jgi:hypothetical protein
MAVNLSALRAGGRFTPQKHFPASNIRFYYRLIKLQGLVRPEVLGELLKTIHLIGSRNPGPSGLQHSALITRQLRGPQDDG